MKNKKKLIVIIILAVILIAGIIAGIFLLNSNDEPTLQETIENRADSYKTDFEDSITQMDSQASVKKYLVNWGENKGIDVTTDKYNNVVYSFEATEGLEDKTPTVILCGYDYSCIESYSNSIVSALIVARDENPHGEYKIIFVSEEDGNKEAGHKLSAYIKDGYEVFYLGNDTSSKIASTTAGVVEYQFNTQVVKTSPSYNKAYKVTISGLPQQTITSKTASAPNPIKLLGNLLATFKSKSVLFDLVEFTGGESSSSTPGEASITIVVSQDATAKVEARLDSAVESFMDKYSEKYPEAAYTYEVIDMPYNVINADVTESIISLLYTAPNGTYNKDDDDNVTTFASITSIDVTSGTATITAVASGYDEALLTEVTDAYQTICALTDIEFKEIRSYPIYKANDEGTLLAEEFTNSYIEYKSNTLNVESMPQYTMCSALIQDYPDIKLVALGVTNKTKDNFAGGLIVHLSKEN